MKKHYCIDCNKKISRRPKVKRCHSCYGKTIMGENNVSKRTSVKIKIGKANKGFVHSLKTKKLCSKLAKYRFKNPKNHPSYKDGRTLKINKCVDCKKIIFWSSKRCRNCHGVYVAKSGTCFKTLFNYKHYKMKSSWELRYAKYLDKYNIKWKYECKTFDLGTTTYTPDFYLPKYNLYIEIKGRWYKDAKQKLILFKKLFPLTKLIIIENFYTDNKYRIFPFQRITNIKSLKEAQNG